jgi:hypothetical protein
MGLLIVRRSRYSLPPTGRNPFTRLGARRPYLAELSALGELRKRHKGERLVSLLIEAAVLHTEANLKVVERADEQAEVLAAVQQRAAVTSESVRETATAQA